jgi:thiamine-monophosphate kinase
MGNALASALLLGQEALRSELESRYRPLARLAEGAALRACVSAMIDTSDGLISALDELARVNGLGVTIAWDPALLDPAALEALRPLGVPPWVLLAGEHGDYELVFAVPVARQAAFEALVAGWARPPVPVGVVAQGPGLQLQRPGRAPTPFAGAFVRNLLADVGGDWPAYVRALWRQAEEMEQT